MQGAYQTANPAEQPRLLLFFGAGINQRRGYYGHIRGFELNKARLRCY